MRNRPKECSMAKLIVLRGNSGSGKSTVAKLLRESATSASKIAVVEQDYLRRIVLKEKENKGSVNVGLIQQSVSYCLRHGYDVVLEGILYSKRYGGMIQALIDEADEHWIYYFDVSFEETLRRHVTKPNAAEFGETEMRSWYNPDDRLGLAREWIIKEASSSDHAVEQILSDTGL